MMLDKTRQEFEDLKHGYEHRHICDEIHKSVPMKHGFVCKFLRLLGVLVADGLPMVHSSSPFSRNIVLNPVNVNGY